MARQGLQAQDDACRLRRLQDASVGRVSGWFEKGRGAMKLDWSILWGDAGLLILHGPVVTLQLPAWVLALAFVLGLAFGTLRWIGLSVTEPICWFYVEFARNTPPVVQILFWYFSASYILPGWLFLQLRDFGYEFGAAVV